MSESAVTPFVNAAVASPLPPSGIGWLDAARREQLAAFVAAGLPDKHVEAWKYTALRALSQRRYAVGDAQAPARAVDTDVFALPDVDGPRLVFVNGVFRADLSQLADLPPGLKLQPLSQALREHPEPLRFALSRAAPDPQARAPADAFAHLNAALATDGMVLQVAAGTTLSQPVHLVFVGAPADGDLASHTRNLIDIGEGAVLTLIEQHVTSAAHAHLGTLMSDTVLRDGARLHHVQLQQAAAASSLIRRSALQVGAHAQATLHVVQLGGALVRDELQARLSGNGARLDTRGVFVLGQRQHVDMQLAITHQARDTTSTSHWRGVAADRSRGVFRGAIVVAPGADGSDASLSNKNLLLSAQAEIDTKPELEIYADEVKAAHGATVGQLDERALFYLRSRGIPHGAARALLTAAFCRAVLDDVPGDALRDHLAGLLQAQLPAI